MNVWQRGALVALAAAGIAGQILDPGPGWEAVPGSFALFGGLGCLLIMGVAKALGRIGISRHPDYYDRRRGDPSGTNGDDRD